MLQLSLHVMTSTLLAAGFVYSKTNVGLGQPCPDSKGWMIGVARL